MWRKKYVASHITFRHQNITSTLSTTWLALLPTFSCQPSAQSLITLFLVAIAYPFIMIPHFNNHCKLSETSKYAICGFKCHWWMASTHHWLNQLWTKLARYGTCLTLHWSKDIKSLANITTIGRTALVKSVISSQVVYSITPLIVPLGTLHNLNKIERAFLCSGSDKTTGAKCKVNWEVVCRPTAYGGLGVLNTDKFARALRLRWLWYEWKEPRKLWVGLGNPCTVEDHDFFYASTTIILGNGAKTPFWDSPWLLGRKPKDIAPLIFEASRRKNWKCVRLWLGTIGC